MQSIEEWEKVKELAGDYSAFRENGLGFQSAFHWICPDPDCSLVYRECELHFR